MFEVVIFFPFFDNVVPCRVPSAMARIAVFLKNKTIRASFYKLRSYHVLQNVTIYSQRHFSISVCWDSIKVKIRLEFISDRAPNVVPFNFYAFGLFFFSVVDAVRTKPFP